MVRSIILPWMFAAMAMTPIFLNHAARMQYSKLTSSRALTLSPTKGNSGSHLEKNLCHATLNIVFVVDGSGSIQKHDWQNVKDFIVQMAMRFRLGEGLTQISVIQFSSQAKVECTFEEHGTTFQTMAECVSGISQMRYRTRSDLGLKLAEETLKGELEKNPLIDAQLVIFLADGLNDDEPANTAAIAKAKEIMAINDRTFIFSLAVGPYAEERVLTQIASPSVAGHSFFFKIDDFHALEKVIEPLLYVGCDSEVIGRPVDLGRGMIKFQTRGEAEQSTDFGGRIRGEQCGNNCVNDIYYGVFRDGRQTQEGFYEVADRWRLVATLGQQLYHLTNGKVMSKFVKGVRAMINDLLTSSSSSLDAEIKETLEKLKDAHSDSSFVLLFSPLLLQQAQNANVMEGYELVAEYQGLKDESLTLDLKHNSEALDLLRTKLAARMISYMHNAAEVESCPLFAPAMIEKMWTEWQNAWGSVRLYVKLTTQCKVHVPPAWPMGKTKREKRASFMNPKFQHLWSHCEKSRPFDVSEYPSAVVGCAREDEADTGPDSEKNRDNMIRYLGCGAQRREEPPVWNGPKTICSINKKNRVWNGILCNAGSLADDSCNLFGPFWSVYSGKTEQIFGWKSDREMSTHTKYSKGYCHMIGKVTKENLLNGTRMQIHPSDNSMCGNSQVEGFKTMINDANGRYIYGNVPDLPVSLAAEHNHGTRRKGWDEGGKAWNQPHERQRDPAIGEVLREVRRGSTVVLLAYGYSGAGKTTTLVGDNSIGIDGVVSLYLKEVSRYVADVDFSAFEVYGRMSPIDGSMTEDVGQGIWAFEPKEGVGTTDIHFLGDWNSFHSSERVDFGKVFDLLGNYKISMAEKLFNGVPAEEQDWAFDIQRLLAEIEAIRRDQKKFAKAAPLHSDAVPQAHIRGTPNNPSSSRGTLFVVLDITFKSGEKGTIAVVDLAGAEDPAIMAAAFMKFLETPTELATMNEHVAWTTESYTQRLFGHGVCNGKQNSMELIRKYLRHLSSDEVMDHQFAECIAFKDIIVECKGHVDEMPTDCAKIKIHGEEKYYRPNVPTGDGPSPKWIRKSYREPEEKFRDFHWRYSFGGPDAPEGMASIPPIPIDEVLEALNGGSAGEGELDSVNYATLRALGYNTKEGRGKSHRTPAVPKICDDEALTDDAAQYKINGRIFNKRKNDLPCAIGSCVTLKNVGVDKVYSAMEGTKMTNFGAVIEERADVQLERVDINLKTGLPTGIDWRMNRCTKGGKTKGKVFCKQANYPPGQCNDLKFIYGRGGTVRSCTWPDRLWHRTPYAIENVLFNAENATARKRMTESAYNKYFRIATVGPINKREQIMLDNLGGDMIGDGKPGSAKLNYDGFLEKLLAQHGETITQGQIEERNKMRIDFWLKLQEYLDEYKIHEEKFRKKWDVHMAYFTQVIGPMIEEALYINEMLNQMRNFLKSVSDWSENRAEKDPWPLSSPVAKMGDPLGAIQKITRDGVKPYAKAEYVHEGGAELPYYMEVQETGRDRVLGLTMLEAIRRRAAEKGAEKYKVLFGAFLRTDKPNGDPDCQGARQSLEFAQLLTESMGQHRKDYLPVLLGPQAVSAQVAQPMGGMNFSQFAFDPLSNM